MLVVTRYRVPRAEAPAFRDQAFEALHTLAQQPGWKRGHVGRATDDPTLWVLTSEWRDVGSYRRALSAYDVKLHVVPLLSRAVDEPTAFEVMTPDGGTALAADAEDVGLGHAAGPAILTDLDVRDDGRGRSAGSTDPETREDDPGRPEGSTGARENDR
ncbi:antibiotic biosynthesis monooxygenase family protein [Phytoactinopolyspora halotolerans]|uniref:Antibiotic biosynthesis monooxygenase n=1 Tax=Phytoactinopolyspora halotolerans TaxID=1981512 RepID=A0A6L9S614_9ACTN|nr:antibiotic biosynthesis monooxygenase family protein [Phytoactinopolyspora halotolerans]NED99957.1 antibiotic biosynthesis monooxygenase [Phytoactinopolyspora halotolerans]